MNILFPRILGSSLLRINVGFLRKHEFCIYIYIVRSYPFPWFLQYCTTRSLLCNALALFVLLFAYARIEPDQRPHDRLQESGLYHRSYFINSQFS